MNSIIRDIRWHLFVRPKVKRAYEQGGAIEAATTIEAYGYGRGAEFTMPMIRALAWKHRWKLNGSRG